ncbi:MAG: helix-turn-helix domain-containing protein [Candidatus Helarchaeota archaeon]
MTKKSEIEFNILKVLEEEDLGLTISQIAEKIKLHRNTTAKYLESMAKKDLIYKIQKGPTSKLFYPARVQKKFSDRADYMVKFYQLLHKALFYDWLGDIKKAGEIGLNMAKEASVIYRKLFKNVEFTFENVARLAALAIEITYPTPNVKAKVFLIDEESCYLEITNCICNENEKYRSICTIQEGLIKGIIDEFLESGVVSVEEIECRCTGHKSCKYKIIKKAN